MLDILRHSFVSSKLSAAHPHLLESRLVDAVTAFWVDGLHVKSHTSSGYPSVYTWDGPSEDSVRQGAGRRKTSAEREGLHSGSA